MDTAMSPLVLRVPTKKPLAFFCSIGVLFRHANNTALATTKFLY